MAQLVQKVAAWWAAARVNPLFWRGLLGAGFLVALDQAAKYWIVEVVKLPLRYIACAKRADDICRQIHVSPIFDLTYVENKGASFGMLSGGLASRIILSSISIGVASMLIAWLARLNRGLAAAGVAFVIGGAIGNLIDRVRQGYVVDFLDFTGLYFPWVFNVADMAINVGIALLALDWWREHQAAKRTPSAG